MEEKIRKNIKKFREQEGLTQKALGCRIGKSESAIQGYESGKTDIPLSVIVSMLKELKISLADLERGSREEKKPDDTVEIRVYTQEERLEVASILVKNGYTVSQGKRRKTPTGKTVEYFLRIQDNEENSDTSK